MLEALNSEGLYMHQQAHVVLRELGYEPMQTYKFDEPALSRYGMKVKLRHLQYGDVSCTFYHSLAQLIEADDPLVATLYWEAHAIIQTALTCAGRKESVMTDLSKIAKQLKSDQMKGTAKSPVGDGVLLKADVHRPMIALAVHHDREIAAVIPKIGKDFLKENGRPAMLREIWAHPETPSILKMAWDELGAGRDFPSTTKDSARIEKDMRAVCERMSNGLIEIRNLHRAYCAAQRDEWSPVDDGQGGSLYVPQWKWQLISGNLRAGYHTLLVGPPGTGKTELGRACAHHDERTFFHMEVSGFSEVSQLEYERIMVVVNGQASMELRPTPWTDALEAVERGERVLVFADEIKRVSDPSILNPWMLALAQNEYHSVVTKKVYRWEPGQLVMFASANDAEGYNFSGNSRRGMDAALEDRFTRIELLPPPADILARVLAARVKGLSDRQLSQIGMVYATAQGDEDMAHRFGVRGAIKLCRAWAILGEGWEISDILERQPIFDAQSTKKIKQMLDATEV